jgi:hypothetical protein
MRRAAKPALPQDMSCLSNRGGAFRVTLKQKTDGFAHARKSAALVGVFADGFLPHSAKAGLAVLALTPQPTRNLPPGRATEVSGVLG